MADTEQVIDGRGGYDYLIRSISIVTLLYERGILKELLDSGALTEEDIDLRASLISQRFPDLTKQAVEEEPREFEEPEE